MSEADSPITITFLTNDGKQVTAARESNLLRISLREKGGLPFKCGGGLCGTCKCRVERGAEHTAAPTVRERKLLTEADFAAGYRLGCQTFVSGDVAISWIPLAERVKP